MGGQETGEPQCPTWGSWPEGLGIQALGNHKPLETLTHPIHRSEERPPTGPPATGGNTYAECGARRAKLLHTRKPRTEVAPGTTTPTRLWGCLAYDSQNPMQQLLSKALVATGPARPTAPSNPCGPLGSAYRFPNAMTPVSFLRLRRGMGRRQACVTSGCVRLRPHYLLLWDYYRLFHGLGCMICLPFEVGLQVEAEGGSAGVDREDSACTGQTFRGSADWWWWWWW